MEFHVKIWCHGVLHLYQCHIILVDHRLVTLYNETPTEVLPVLFLPVKWRHPPLFQATVKTYNFNRQWARHTELRLVLLCCRDGIELNIFYLGLKGCRTSEWFGLILCRRVFRAWDFHYLLAFFVMYSRKCSFFTPLLSLMLAVSHRLNEVVKCFLTA